MNVKNILEIAEDRIISDLCLIFFELNNKILSNPDDLNLKNEYFRRKNSRRSRDRKYKNSPYF